MPRKPRNRKPAGSDDYRRALREMRRLGRLLDAAEGSSRRKLADVSPEFRQSALNLIHYVALRRHDISRLQDLLAELGLSSLGRCEPRVRGTIGAVASVLDHLSNPCRDAAPPAHTGIEEGRHLLEGHAARLLGPGPKGRYTRIMVTMPAGAGDDPALLDGLLKNGMDCVRINCAHDGPAEWAATIRQLRLAQKRTNRPCRVLMDLGGPKLRTGPVGQSPAVVRWKPEKDSAGRPLAPAVLWLRPEGAPGEPPEGVSAVLPLDPAWLARLKEGDEIRLTDLREKHRHLSVTALAPQGGVYAECRESAYAGNGCLFEHRRGRGQRVITRLRSLPPVEAPVELREGDVLVITRDPSPGTNAVRDPSGAVIRAARISCTLPEVFGQVRRGERVLLDDGKASGVILRADRREIWTEIREIRGKRLKLRADKGINFPDSELKIGAVTEKDREDLKFIVRHADMVGVSFVQSAADLRTLYRELDRLGGTETGIVLKIETRRGFEDLPELMLAAMQRPAAGVMIARGDLAVELGYGRLAEVQEEILWIASAAHLPVIWATEVLDLLAKSGIPTRAEVTDAAMAERAECVMLNKGPHIVRAVAFLDDVLRRMERHQWKKVPRFSRLRSW